jgi:hypothetical protein
MVQWCAQSGCKSLATHDVKMYAPQRWSACKLRVFQQLTQARWCRWHATVEARLRNAAQERRTHGRGHV